MVGGLLWRSSLHHRVGILKVARKQGLPKRTVLANVKSMALVAGVEALLEMPSV